MTNGMTNGVTNAWHSEHFEISQVTCQRTTELRTNVTLRCRR